VRATDITALTYIAMITHIVCWKYKPDTTDQQRSEHIARLRALPMFISDIESFSVGSDILHLDRPFDTGLLAVYRDMTALDAYTEHPEHQRLRPSGGRYHSRLFRWISKVQSPHFSTPYGLSGNKLKWEL
jgi:hypothetical protein